MALDEKDKVIFEQDCLDFRSMNEILWKVPIIVITLTGGLWFGVGSMDISDDAKKYLLYLAGAANITFILVLFRLRWVMGRTLEGIKAFQGRQTGFQYIFVILFSIMLGFSAYVSFYAATKGAVFYKKPNIETEPQKASGKPGKKLP